MEKYYEGLLFQYEQLIREIGYLKIPDEILNGILERHKNAVKSYKNAIPLLSVGYEEIGNEWIQKLETITHG